VGRHGWRNRVGDREPRRVNGPLPLVGGDMFVEEATCWICGHQQMRPLADAAFELSAYRHQDPALAAYTGARVALCRCRECGFAQPDRVPALPGFFDRMYAQQWSAEWIAREFEGGWKDLIFRNVLDGLEARLPPDRRALLDVGAHAGRFLQLAQRRGWSVEGVEVNPRTAAHAEQQTGARVHRMSALGLDAMGQRFDALTLTDVLEHIPDPLRMLGKAKSALSTGGWLAVKVPCGPVQVLKERLRARVHRGYRPRLADNLVHVNHFSVRSLDLALNRAGFRNVRIEIGAPECPHQSAIANLLRLTIYRAGRRLPFGLYSPCALNLQAFAQKP
jgi:SAM-dependent methyltransferase